MINWIVIVFFLCSTSLSAKKIDVFLMSASKSTSYKVKYDPAYFKIKYLMGDVPIDRGVCTDVIIRSYRSIGIDLQEFVHVDMSKNFKLYPRLWNNSKTDTNIDHRRVPNLIVFFRRFGKELVVSENPKDYKAGDIVTWNLRENGDLPHIGIVSDKINTKTNRPYIIHNIGSGPEFEDMLFDYQVTGHFRYGLD